MSLRSIRRWGVTSSTKPYLTKAHMGGKCVVCGEHVEARTVAWHVAWTGGLAHEACGWIQEKKEAPP